MYSEDQLRFVCRGTTSQKGVTSVEDGVKRFRAQLQRERDERVAVRPDEDSGEFPMAVAKGVRCGRCRRHLVFLRGVWVHGRGSACIGAGVG